eukprot:512779_1
MLNVIHVILLFKMVVHVGVMIHITNVLSDEISYHWIIVGKQSQWGDIKTPECVPDRSNYASIYTANGYENKIGVGCCNQDGTTGTRPDCLLEATYSEANDKCEEEGLRLCTAIEIYNDDLGVDSGCEFNKRYVWTDTECEYGSDTFYFVKLSNVGGLLKQISVSSDGDVYGMGGFGDGAIFKWHNAGWVRLKNDQNYVSAVTSTTLWMINGGSTPGHIYIGYINDVDTADISWVLKGISPAGNLFTQVASRLVDSVFYTFALDEENNLYKYDVSGTETWISMNTNDYNHITVGSEYSLWGIGTSARANIYISDGAAYEWKNNEWIYHGFGTNLLKFIDISVSSEGVVIGIDAAHYLYFWTGIEWQRIYYDNIAIKQISVGKFESGKMWGVDYDISSNIYQITDISPTFEQRHWIIVGKEVFAPGKPPECAYDFSSIGSGVNSYGNKIGVGCCNGTHGFRPDCDSDPSTFFKAELICEEYGYRLCTADEIYTDGMGVGKGGNYDAYHVWTDTECDIGDIFHVGCYTDNINSVRAMDTRYQGPYTIESCNAECNTRYFALQNGGTCWCDDSYDDAIYFDISTNCAGDGLGGPNANDLYVSTNVLSDEISYHWIIVGKQSQWGDIKTPECVPD